MKEKVRYIWKHIEIATIIVFFSLMCIVTFMSVITRYFLSFTFTWAEQFSRICFVIITFAGISWAASTGSHLKVTALTGALPPKIARVVILFGDVLSALFGIVMSYQIFKLVRMQIMYKQVFSAIPGLSVAVMYIPGVIFLILFAIRIFEFSILPTIRLWQRKEGTGEQKEEVTKQ